MSIAGSGAQAMHQGSEPGASGASETQASYRHILKSSAVMGGATLVNVAIGIVRIKILALLLGPAGVGLMGTLTSLLDLSRAVADAGVTRSGVRQIADARARGDTQKVNGVALVLRRLTFLLGIIGACALFLLSDQVAVMTFGNAQHGTAVAILASALFFALVADGNGALLQGARRIDDLARMGILGSILGAITSVALIFFLREQGVALALASIALISAVLSWRLSKRLHLVADSVDWPFARVAAGQLLRLGMAFMFSSLVLVGASFAVRAILLRLEGMESTGLFQAAWSIGGMYAGFILQAMSTDYYPRLVSVAQDNDACNQLVREQSQISILIAGPGVVATLVFAPVLVSLFYSSSFLQAADTLRWVCMGMALKVMTWPMGFILIAKNKQALLMAVDLTWAVLNVILSWFFINEFGLMGAGLAFCASYVCHAAIVLPLAKSLTGYRPSRDYLRAACLLVLLCAITAASATFLPGWAAYCVGVAALCVSTVHSVRTLTALTASVGTPKKLLRLFEMLRSIWPWLLSPAQSEASSPRGDDNSSR